LELPGHVDRAIYAGAIVESTGKDFVAHWAWAAKQGILKENTAGALRAAAQAVIEIDPNWQNLDVTKLDVDGLVKRFKTVKSKNYKPKSLKEYDRRFRKAHASFLEYLKDPSEWKPVQERAPRGNGDNPEGRRPDFPAKPAASSPAQPSPGFVEYPFPLREGRIVRMSLPTDLKAAEVKRLSAFLGTLVVEEE
jgi:hypothetical protein